MPLTQALADDAAIFEYSYTTGAAGPYVLPYFRHGYGR